MHEYMDILQQLILGNSVLVYLAIFLIGFISSLNPHMLGMVPMYMGYMVDDRGYQRKWRDIALFSLSFSIILTVLGIGVSIIGMSFRPIMTVSYIIAGLVYLYIGFKLLGFRLSTIIPIKIVVFYSRKKRSGNRFLSKIVMPLIFTPCSLPFIVSVLTLAMLRGSILYGAIVLFVFGLGHSLIFVLFGVFSSLLIKLNQKLSENRTVHRLLGVLFIVVGILFLSLNQSPSVHIHH